MNRLLERAFKRVYSKLPPPHFLPILLLHSRLFIFLFIALYVLLCLSVFSLYLSMSFSLSLYLALFIYVLHSVLLSLYLAISVCLCLTISLCLCLFSFYMSECVCLISPRHFPPCQFGRVYGQTFCDSFWFLKCCIPCQCAPWYCPMGIRLYVFLTLDFSQFLFSLSFIPFLVNDKIWHFWSCLM